MLVGDLLAQLGYTLTFRQVGWFECLLAREDEQWIGRGRTEEEALRRALAAACPSHLAQTLLAQATTTQVQAVVDASPQPAAAPVMDVSPETPLVSEPVEPTVAPAIELPYGSADALAEAVASGDLVVDPVGKAPIEESQIAAVAGRLEAIEALEVLLAKIDADADELARCAPQRQRLVLLAWIARARALQHGQLGDDDVDDLVTDIAHAVGALSRRWWPGSVPALQQAALPADAARVLPGSAQATSWDEVAELAERALAELEASDSDRGFDEYGWADVAACIPAPAQPDEMLHEVVAELDELLPRATTDGGALLGAARRLRWARTSVRDIRAWSTALGLLRRRVSQDRFGLGEIARVLEPSYAPSAPWASSFGASPARKTEIDPRERAADVERISRRSRRRVGPRRSARGCSRRFHSPIPTIT